MYSRIETINPEMAKEYLKKNNVNRVLRRRTVQKYATEMKNGDWQLTDEGISFYTDGSLANGQHRLNAVIEANIPVDFYVTRDVPKQNTIHDRGQKRTSSDILRLDGITSSASSTNALSLVNFMFFLAQRQTVGDSTLKKFICENEEMICETLRISGITSNKMQLARKAPVMAAVFCALYCGVPEDGLCNFIKILNHGFTESQDETAAIVLRNYLIQDFVNSNSQRIFAFAVATNAIKDFANGNPRRKRYKTNIDPAFWIYTKKKAFDKYLEK